LVLIAINGVADEEAGILSSSGKGEELAKELWLC
jgi:hypothetical protein